MSASIPAAFAQLPPHLVLRNAFGPQMVERLLGFAMAHETEFSEASISTKEDAKIDPTVRLSRVIRDFGDVRSEIEACFRAAMPAALAGLGIPPFDLAGLSLELAAHGDGAFYRRHIDTFVGKHRTATDRVLTGVYYFHAEPKAFTGGELRLFSLLGINEGGTYIDIEPLNDSLLLFPAWAPHEVRPISCPGSLFAQSRFAINCWYTRQAV